MGKLDKNERKHQIEVIKASVKMLLASYGMFDVCLEINKNLLEKNKVTSVKERERLIESGVFLTEKKRSANHLIIQINKELTRLEPENLNDYVNDISFVLLERKTDKLNKEIDVVLSKSIELLNRYLGRQLQINHNDVLSTNFVSTDMFKEEPSPIEIGNQLNNESKSNKPKDHISTKQKKVIDYFVEQGYRDSHILRFLSSPEIRKKGFIMLIERVFAEYLNKNYGKKYKKGYRFSRSLSFPDKMMSDFDNIYT